MGGFCFTIDFEGDSAMKPKTVMNKIHGVVALAGHSYGGSVATEAGNGPKVSALVYIAASAVDDGGSCASMNASHVACVSRPKETARFIEDAATSAHFNR
jgi:pimeloyl-ACP methyl ester carboxylesterase